jgi:16S rRNA (cytosine967-C5)-methyltransferase
MPMRNDWRSSVRARAAPAPASSAPTFPRVEIVLLDAPCSGSGSWRRNPETKWRLTPERLASLTRLQDELLDRAALHTGSGGRLVYATCSVLLAENDDRVAAFLARWSGFRPLPVAEVWRETIGTPPPPGTDQFFRASPRLTGSDGFFAALFTRE